MLIALDRDPKTALLDAPGYISKLRTFKPTRAISVIYDELRQVHGLLITHVPKDLAQLREVYKEVQSKHPWLEESEVSGQQDSRLDATSVLDDMLQVFGLGNMQTSITSEPVLVVAIITGGLCGRKGKVYIGEDVLGAAHELTQSSRTEQPPRSSRTPPGEPVITTITPETSLEQEVEGGIKF